MKKFYVSLCMASSVLLGACATTVKPTYISPTLYQALNCQQLQSEYNRIQQYVDNGVQPAKRTGVGVGVGLGGGWVSKMNLAELDVIMGDKVFHKLND